MYITLNKEIPIRAIRLQFIYFNKTGTLFSLQVCFVTCNNKRQ